MANRQRREQNSGRRPWEDYAEQSHESWEQEHDEETDPPEPEHVPEVKPKWAAKPSSSLTTRKRPALSQEIKQEEDVDADTQDDVGSACSSSSSASTSNWQDDVWNNGVQKIRYWPAEGSAAHRYYTDAGFNAAGAPPEEPQYPQPTYQDVDANVAASRSRSRSREQRRNNRENGAWYQNYLDEKDSIRGSIMEPALTEVIDVPKAYIAKVIGKSGQSIVKIRKETGAQVDARKQTEDPVRVKVLGTVAQIEKARDMIWDLVEISDIRPKTGQSVEVSRSKIGKVIGIRGAQIQVIQNATGAKLDVKKDCDPCLVMLNGTDAQVEAAKKEIRKLTMEEADLQNSEYMYLPKWSTGALLGVGGKRLKEIQDESGVRIDVDKSDPNYCVVRVEGDPEQRRFGKELVNQAASAPRDATMPALPATAHFYSEQVYVPAHAAGAVIGSGGTALKQIQTETGCRVYLEQGSEECTVSGPTADAVAYAKSWIEQIVWSGQAAPMAAVPAPVQVYQPASRVVVNPFKGKAAGKGVHQVQPGGEAQSVKPLLQPKVVRPKGAISKLGQPQQYQQESWEEDMNVS